jgi:hypothetical protein
LGGENLDDHIGKLLLGVNVSIEIGLSGLNGSHDGFKRVTTLFHITLDLPVKLDIIRDIKVKGEVKQVTDTIVVHGVKTLEDDDRGGFDGLGSVKSSVDVVVDGLRDGLSVLEGLDLLVHEVEVVLKRVEGGESRNLTSVTIIRMVVIKADDSGEVRDQGVSLPSSIAKSTSKGSDNVSSEDRGKTTHESRLSTSRISGNTNNDWGLSILQGHVEAAGGGGSGQVLGHESRRSEGGDSAEREKGKGELHD